MDRIVLATFVVELTLRLLAHGPRDTDLFRPGEAARRVERYDPAQLPSRTRRALHLIDAARAHSLRNNNLAVVDHLDCTTSHVSHLEIGRNLPSANGPGEL